MAFEQDVISFLAERFPGAELSDFGVSPVSQRLGGVMAWSGFADREPLDRQNAIWEALRERFANDELRQITMILTFTPEELQAVDET